MNAQHTPALHAAAHMAECRHQRHAFAVQYRKLWHSLHGAGIGCHPDGHAARLQMRHYIAAARHYRKGQRHYAAIANPGACS